MIGHCTALAVIVTKTLAGKISEPKQEKDEELTTPPLRKSFFLTGGDTEAKQVLRNERVGALKETIGALTGAWYYPLTSLPLETNGATPLSAVIPLRHSASPCSDITATHA